MRWGLQARLRCGLPWVPTLICSIMSSPASGPAACRGRLTGEGRGCDAAMDGCSGAVFVPAVRKQLLGLAAPGAPEANAASSKTCLIFCQPYTWGHSYCTHGPGEAPAFCYIAVQVLARLQRWLRGLAAPGTRLWPRRDLNAWLCGCSAMKRKAAGTRWLHPGTRQGHRRGTPPAGSAVQSSTAGVAEVAAGNGQQPLQSERLPASQV